MSAERRLAKLEASLPTRQAVLLWLRQAHEHGSLGAYLASLVDGPGRSPLVDLTERVAAATRAAHAREPRATVRAAERHAVMDVVFLVMLVLELEREAGEATRIGALRLDGLSWEHRARIAEGAADRRGWTAWRAAVTDLATDLARGEAVRVTVVERHLDGREVLFPTTLAAWQSLREGVSASVVTMATVPGGRKRRRADIDAIGVAAQRAASEGARHLVERVRARTIDVLGDHAGASAIVERAQRGSAWSASSRNPPTGTVG